MDPVPPHANINPRPEGCSKKCPKCQQLSLTAPFECKGNGKELTNYGRYLQKCELCDHFEFLNPPTPIEKVPYEVQMRYTLKKSAQTDGDGSLLCPAAGCKKNVRENKPRDANTRCTRATPHCAPCCKDAGGCNLNTHRLAIRDLTTTEAEKMQSRGLPSGSSSSSPSTSEPIRRVYARPLNESYAKPYINNHRHLLEESSKVAAEEKIKDASYAILWAKWLTKCKGPNSVATAPHHIRTINEKRGLFVPNSCPLIVAASSSSTAPGFISVLQSAWPRCTWVSQDLLLPIPVSPTSRVLLRTCDMVDSDCLDFHEETSLFRSCGGPLFTTVGAGVKSQAIPISVSSTPRVLARPPPPTLPVQMPAPGRFPRKYTSDMASGMYTLSQVKGDGAGLQAAFEKEFPGYHYVSATVYRHITWYRGAIEYGLLNKYVQLGHTAAGKWSALVEEVDKIVKKKGKKSRPSYYKSQRIFTDLSPVDPVTIDLTGPVAVQVHNQSSPIDVDADDEMGPSNTFILDEDLLAMQNFNCKMTMYRYAEGALQDYCAANTPDIDVMVFDDFVPGEKYHVHLASFVVPGRPQFQAVTIAIKKIVLPKNWWARHWPSFAAAIWVEGARAATCNMLFQEFTLRARGFDINLPDLDVVETSFVSRVAGAAPAQDDDEEWLAQPWHFGIPFSVGTLDLNNPHQADIANILSAFSHFSYQHTKHRSVYVDFQGKFNHFYVCLYRIMDSRTHVMPVELPTEDDDGNPLDLPQFSVNGGVHFLGSQGEAGLAEFRASHNCTSTCGMMQLNPIPLIFSQVDGSSMSTYS
ncbi:hypothetical protein B0H11DRAFT_1899433 [Mycena galericulata]|nr:hypothetical protein B0H11DRAFT_1899433 [Mycena galericulata]